MISKSTPAITSYDFLKIAALLLMVVDHIGVYFYPDDLWFRAIGRICVPIWFFLIGYARSRDISLLLWGGGFILIAANFVVGMPLFPANILISILLIRLSLDWCVRYEGKSKGAFYALLFGLTLLIFPTGLVTEYGTQGLICAMLGYFVRHKGGLNNFTIGYMLFSAALFIFFQYGYFGFSGDQTIAMSIGVVAVSVLLLMFKPVAFQGLSSKLPSVVVSAMMFCGRHTLEIYVLHLIAFKVAALLIGQDGYAWFDLQFLEEDALNFSGEEQAVH